MPPELPTDSIMDGFRGGTDGGWDTFVPLLVILAVTLLFLLLVRLGVKLYARKRRHLILFDELSDHHRLGRGQRKFLMAAAKAGGIQSVEMIFVQPTAFDTYVKSIGANSDWVPPLREQLYGYPESSAGLDTRVKRMVNTPDDPPEPPSSDDPTDVMTPPEELDTKELPNEEG